MRRFAVVRYLIPCLALCLLLEGCVWGRRRRWISQHQYMRLMERALDATRDRMRNLPTHRLEFSANLFYAHEVVIEYAPLDVLKKEVDAFRELGLSRVDINMGSFPWRQNRRDVIDKYDALIHYIRKAGLKLVINPEYSVVYNKTSGFDAWKKDSLPVYTEIARRYHPDIFVVAHEPTTMNKRMKSKASPDAWRDYVRDAARAVKKASPKTLIGAGGLCSEESYFKEFLSLDEINVVTVDIYNLAGLRKCNQMIKMAKKAGKPVYVEETWRNPYFTRRDLRKSLEAISAKGIGDRSFEQLDIQWLQTITRYASVWGLEAITPFWTQTFFLYVKGDGDALSPKYNKAVMEAILKGERTDTFRAYQRLVQEYGKGTHHD